MNIPEVLYNYYRALPRPPTRNYSVYVTHPLDDEVVKSLASNIEAAAEKDGFDSLQKVELASSFVQSLEYTSDSVTTGYDNWPRYPIETLVDSGGDCEDTSILLASLLDAMGYGVVIIVYPGQHAAVGVLGGSGIYGHYFDWAGGQYFYIETTGEGWEVGEMPEEYIGHSAKIYDMTPVPILTHTWTGASTGRIVSLNIKVENLGTAIATGVYVLAGFDAGQDMVWNKKISDTFELTPGYECTIQMTLLAPSNEHTRLIVQTIYDGYSVDESYSEWFDTW
jgi:hypothetical protein